MDKAKSLMALFCNFRVPEDRNKDQHIEAFRYQASRFPDEVVQQAVQAFIDGRVVGQSGVFLPMPTEFAIACETFMEPVYRAERQKRLNQEALQQLEFKGPSDEVRAATVERELAKRNAYWAEHCSDDGRVGAQSPFSGLNADGLKDPRPIEERLKLKPTIDAYQSEKTERKKGAA